MSPGHDHELDAKLHELCPMCAEILRLCDRVDREGGADNLSRHYAAIARSETRDRERARGRRAQEWAL